MRISGKVKIVFGAIALLVAASALAVWLSLPRLNTWVVGFHQKSVTHSLATWAPEVATITNDASAIHAAEMVGYMSSYYVPGEGYRGSATVEAALEAQRRQSIAMVVASLERYTGLDYGTNVERWTEWVEKRKNSEPDGAANRSQPIRAETNRTSAAAGPDR
jgi:hypothetical protein